MGNILSRIQEISQNEGITIGALERKIGASKGVLSRAINKGTDIQSKWLQFIVENYPTYSTRWLLTGEGSMLRTDDMPTQQITSSSNVHAESVVHSDAITLRLMDKLDEKDTILKEKESKIDHLQSELRQKSEELAALKVQYQHSQDKECDQSNSKITDSFIDKSLGDYGGDSLPMNQPTGSKTSLVGKT